MVCKELFLFCLLTIAFSTAMHLEINEEREKRDTGTDALAKVGETFEGFKENINSLVSNFTKSDMYKQFEQFSTDLGEKGKELGAKIEETLKNLKNKAGGA